MLTEEGGITTSERSLDELADEIATLAAHISATTCRWLELIAEFDARAGWAEWGCRSCAHWVAWRCSMSLATARDHVRVASRLGSLPLTAAAFARGELSFSKVRALTRLKDVTLEQELVALAREATAAQLDQTVAAYRGVVEIAEGHERAAERRSVTWHHDDDGAFVLRCRLPAEEGAVVLAAIEAARDSLARDRLAAGRESRPADASQAPAVTSRGAGAPVRADAPEEAALVTNADAFVLAADRSLTAGADATRNGGERYQVTLELDAATLAGGAAESVAITGDGAALPAETARRIACDATVVCSHEGRSGRRVRTIPAAVRRGLRRRDGGCRFPGCTHRRHVDAHHIKHWAQGGASTIDNLVELCRHHHRLLHEGGYTLTRDERGELTFHRPDGRRLRRSPRLPRGRADRACTNPRIGPSTIVPRWAGDPLDLDLAVDALLRMAPVEPRVQRARPLPVESVG